MCDLSGFNYERQFKQPWNDSFHMNHVCVYNATALILSFKKCIFICFTDVLYIFMSWINYSNVPFHFIFVFQSHSLYYVRRKLFTLKIHNWLDGWYWQILLSGSLIRIAALFFISHKLIVIGFHNSRNERMLLVWFFFLHSFFIFHLVFVVQQY